MIQEGRILFLTVIWPDKIETTLGEHKQGRG